MGRSRFCLEVFGVEIWWKEDADGVLLLQDVSPSSFYTALAHILILHGPSHARGVLGGPADFSQPKCRPFCPGVVTIPNEVRKGPPKHRRRESMLNRLLDRVLNSLLLDDFGHMDPLGEESGASQDQTTYFAVGHAGLRKSELPFESIC